MDDIKDEIAELKRHIALVSPMVERDLAAINESTPRPVKMIAEFNAATLADKKARLQELLDAEREHELEVHLTGPNIAVGSAPQL